MFILDALQAHLRMGVDFMLNLLFQYIYTEKTNSIAYSSHDPGHTCIQTFRGPEARSERLVSFLPSQRERLRFASEITKEH